MHQIKFSWGVLLGAAGVLVLSGCMAPKPKAGEIFSCVQESDLTKTIAPEASLENFTCVVKEWNGANALHFNISVKNVSSEDQRYKINIFLENGKAVGGLLPRKTKKGLVKPGDIAEFSYPVKGMDTAPGKIDLIIKTMRK